MKLLAGTNYDPAGAVTKAASSLLAMTAIDTTNLRLTFTVPSNGSVLVRMRGVMGGAASTAMVLFGVLDHTNSDVVKVRIAPLCGKGASSTNQATALHASFVITGLTPGASLTYDAAYSVEVAVGSCVLRYGGANDTTVSNSGGGFAFEVWDTPGLLGAAHYDPGTAATASVASLLAMTALDTTNLRLTFTAPSSGNVYVHMRGVTTNTTVVANGTYWGVLDGATVRFRQKGVGGINSIQTTAATDFQVMDAAGLVTGLTPGTSYTWDAAYLVDATQTSGLVSWGGPDNATTNDAWGGFAFDIWNVDSLPRAIGSVA